MNLYIFVSLLFGLQGLYWLVGKKFSKNLKGKEDYFLASKKVKFFPLMMTFLATQVGGGLVLGAAEEAFQYGWSTLFLPLGASLGMILLGLGIGKKMAKFPVTTVAQILKIVYGSSLLRTFASILSILSLFMILVAQIMASSQFLASVGLTNTPLFILFWAIVIVYTVQGGLRAVISTDLIQAAFFTFVFIGAFFFILYTIPTFSYDLTSHAVFKVASNKIGGWFWMPLLFMLIEQDMGQRCFSGDSLKAVSKAAFWSGIATFIVCFIPVFLGVLAKKMGIVAVGKASILMVMIEKVTNPWIAALVGCAVLAAIISTATSLINAISSNIFSDFENLFFQKKQNVNFLRGITLTISIGAIFFAFCFNNIVDLLIQSYDLSVSCLFVPILFAFFKKKGKFSSALLSLIFGFLGFFFFRIYPIFIPKELASVVLSLIGYGIGEFFPIFEKKAA